MISPDTDLCVNGITSLPVFQFPPSSLSISPPLSHINVDIIDFIFPVLWTVVLYCILLPTIQIKLNNMAGQIIRLLQQLVNRICKAIRERVASISEFILDAPRESMILAMIWTIYLCVGASCLAMGAALYTGLVVDMPASSRKIDLAALQDLGVLLTFPSSLTGAISPSSPLA